MLIHSKTAIIFTALLIDRVEEKLDTLQRTVAEMKNTSENAKMERMQQAESLNGIIMLI